MSSKARTDIKALESTIKRATSAIKRVRVTLEKARDAAQTTEESGKLMRERREVHYKAQYLHDAATALVNLTSGMSERERAERALNDAQSVLQRDYYEDVNGVAAEFDSMWKRGEFNDRDSAIEWLEQTTDGHARVIYTHQAQTCLLVSKNDSAGPDELGADSFNFKDGMPWSALAYWAFLADIKEAITVDMNDDPPSEGDEWIKVEHKEGCDNRGHLVQAGERCESCEVLAEVPTEEQADA